MYSARDSRRETHPGGHRWQRLIRRLRAWLRERYEVALELAERQVLLDRPWEGEFVHWSGRSGQWELHGHLPPLNDGRRRGVTQGGWCACARTGGGTGVP